jgi:serine protease AprX
VARGRKQRALPQGSTPKNNDPEGPTTVADDRPKQFSIPPDLVEHILFGPEDDRRVLQDSPLLGDVWTAYALDPGVARDVLITPHRQATAAGVAREIPKALKVHAEERAQSQVPQPASRPHVRAKVAYLQGLIGANLYFDEVLRVLVPRTQWWCEPKMVGRIAHLKDDDKRAQLKKLLGRGLKETTPLQIDKFDDFNSLQRYIALAGLIFWISKLERPVDPKDPSRPIDKLEPLDAEQAFQKYQPYRDEIIQGMFTLYEVVIKNPKALPPGDKGSECDEGACSIFQVSLNRPAAPALERSVPAVKGDAAKTLFQVSCKNIIWAILDSGIQHDHGAFCKNGTSRIKKIFDFTSIREIMSNDKDDVDSDGVAKLSIATGLSENQVKKNLKIIAEDFENERPTNWSVVEKLITVKNAPAQLPSPHGTHVAGIIGADRSADADYTGMCPDIGLYDFRVLGKTLDDTEFAVIAALQFIRYINERHSYITVHGANLSLSIPHNVRNFACGRTPVCNECERLVESGVVVVAAAGNRGFQKFETKEGLFENYAAFSITDPGNAESVITVGSTHSIWPNTYGVSFFSSRGPTGDGRLKPDLVAPGERIHSTVTGNDYAPESGTSMAAPHVSGAAAMLLARYEELIGQPRRVKRILCDTATDLGRERTFQGRGMLDVLRAFQSI